MDKQSKQLFGTVLGTLAVCAIGVAVPIPRPALHTMPSQGMEPTVPLYSRLWINYNAYRSSANVHRGDIILFAQPKSPTTTSLRRIIGVPGDQVRMWGTSLWVNGQKINHTLVKNMPDGAIYSEGRYRVFYFYTPANPAAHDLATTLVPPEHFFVLGDHRDDSLDSRMLGCIPFSSIQGRTIGK